MSFRQELSQSPDIEPLRVLSMGVVSCRALDLS